MATDARERRCDERVGTLLFTAGPADRDRGRSTPFVAAMGARGRGGRCDPRRADRLLHRPSSRWGAAGALAIPPAAPRHGARRRVPGALRAPQGDRPRAVRADRADRAQPPGRRARRAIPDLLLWQVVGGTLCAVGLTVAGHLLGTYVPGIDQPVWGG